MVVVLRRRLFTAVVMMALLLLQTFMPVMAAWQPGGTSSTNSPRAVNPNRNSTNQNLSSTNHYSGGLTHVWSGRTLAGIFHQQNLNLASTTPTATGVRFLNNRTVDINVGGTQLAITANTDLTSAEKAAVMQVLRTGQQSLLLDAQGSADGGSLTIGPRLSSQLSNLVIPQGVTVTDVSRSGRLNLSGDLTDNGSLYLTTTNPALNNLSILASNITIGPQGLLSTVIPAPLFAAAPANLNLSLTSQNNISNAGTIVSSGTLNLTAGTGNIKNNGLITSTNGSINISALNATTDININAAGGTLQALAGNINVRDSSYNGAANIDLTGGNYLSRELNLYTGTGTATAVVGQLTGNLNTVAGAEHVSTDTAVLSLGNNYISGDPTYYNTGSIEILGTVSSTEDLAIIAGGDITANANGQIVTNGNNLLMIAGANITSTCTGCTSPGPGTIGPTSGGTPTSGLAEGTVTASLVGGSGGNIDLSGSTAATVIDTSSSTSAGGNVILVALADVFGAKGQVILNSGTNLGEINSSGGGAGGGGNVTVYAGASSLLPITSISTNKIVTISSGTSNSGSVTLQTTQAVTSNGQVLVLDAHGDISSGNTIESGATLTLAGISTGTIDTEVKGGSAAAGNVTIKAYGDINTSAGTIATINNGTGASGEVVLTSTNGSVSTGEIDSFVYGGWLAASNVTISAYGNITTNGNFIYAFQGGSGAGGTITLTSMNGSVSTGLLLTGVGDTVAAGNVNVSAFGDITIDKIYAFNAGTGGGGTVTLTSSNGAISTGQIDTNTNLGLVAAGNVTVSAYGDITIGGTIDASNAGTGTGGTVTLLTQSALSTGDIKTSSTGLLGGAITAAAAGNDGSYSIVMGNLNTSGSAAAGSVEIVSTDLGGKSALIGTITAQASGQSGVGGAVGIATRGSLAVGNIDTTNTSSSATSGAQSGSVFLSSGSIASDAILAGSINAYNSANGSATGQVILIASGTIGVLGTITTSAGNSSINPSYTSFTTSISSSTTINVSVTGISGLFSNYNPQGYSSISGGSTQLTIDSGGNSSLLAPLLCLGAVSIESINSNSGTQADGVALAAFGNITLSGTVGVNTVGTTSGGNVNLLSITGQVSVDGLATSSSGAKMAGNVNVSAPGFINVSGTINASNSGTGAGGTVTLISSTSSVSVGEIDTYVTGGSGPAGTVNISAYQDINTNGNAINTSNAGTGSGGAVFLVSGNGSVTTGEIDTYVTGAAASAGFVSISAYENINTNNNAIAAYNGATGSSGTVMLISSNSSVSVGEIDTYVTSGSEKAADVTVSAYGDINLNGAINAANTGSGAGSTINLLSADGSVTTKSIDVDVSSNSIVAGNVNIEASKAIDTSAGTIQAINGGTRPIDSGVTLTSHTSSVTTGGINIGVTAGSAVAGNVTISAPGVITVGAAIDASNSGTGGGGTVTLESSENSVTFSQIDTNVQSSSVLAGGVSILAYGLINGGGAINASNAGIGAGGAGAAGTVTLISSTRSVTAGGINTNVSGGSAVAGNVTILANGSITANGAINTSNAGTGPGGEVAITSGSGSVLIDGIQTNVSGGSAAAGNVIITAPGDIAVTGAIATNNTGAGAGGAVALISQGTISLSTITTSGTPGGSVFLSSGYAGTGAIVTGAITLGGGALLATAATSGSIMVQSFTDGNTLSVDNGHIYATGTYSSAVNILPLVFTNSATVTITPAIIPGGGFASFNNTGTITLANDAGASGNVIAFSNFLPVYVQGAVNSLGTINDSTGQANFFVVAPTVSVSSATTYNSITGSLNILANQMSLAAINTNGANLNLTALQAITTGIINTNNSGGTVAGSATLLSVISSVTTDAIDTYIVSGSAPGGNVTISADGAITTGNINASNSGTGIGGTVNLTTSGNGSVETGEISTSINNTSSNAVAGNITIFAAGAISTNPQPINAFNLGTGAAGTLTLTSDTYSITTGDIDTHVTSGSAPAGNVFISAYESITTGDINASNSGTGAGGNVALVRAAYMTIGNIDTTSTNSVGGSIVAVSVGDNDIYSLAMGNLNTSGSTAGGSVMLVADDFGETPLLVGTITTNASGPSGVGGSVGLSSLGKLAVGTIDTTNTSSSVNSGAQSGSVFLSSGSEDSNAISAGIINAYNSANGSATGQVILIASGTITTYGAITTSAGTIPAQTFTSNVVSGTEASVNPSYTSDKLSITTSTTVNVSVIGISGSSSNYNPQGYAALSGTSTVLTVDSGGNSLLLAPLVFTAYVPMSINSIKSASSTTADGIALVVFGNLTLADGINAAGSISGGLVTLQSSAGQIAAASIDTNSSGAGAAGNINISAWSAIPVTGTINASNSGTGSGGSVFLASTNNSVTTGGINTNVSGGSATAGNVTIAAYESTSTQAINTSNIGTGAGGTVFLTSSNSSVTTGEIDTNVTSGSGAGNVTISAYGAITAGGAINASNAGTGSGTGGVVNLTSSTSSVSTGTIDTHVEGGSGNGGYVTISTYGAINISDTIDTANAGTGTSGTVTLTSSNGSVSTEAINATDYGGLVPTSNVTISAYGAINTNQQPISTYNAGPGAGGTITLISSHDAVSTGLLFTAVGNSVQAGNVIISASGDITTNLWPILAFNQGTGGGGTVTLTSSGGTITTGGIETYVGLGLVAAGNVAISAYGSITISGPPYETAAIDASNKGTGSGGNVTLLSRAGAMTILGDVDTSSAGFIGGAIAAAAGGDNGLYSILMGNLNTSGSAAGNSVLVVSKDSMGTAIGTITTQASGQSGVGGSVGIASLGTLAVGNIDTTSIYVGSTSSGAQSGSVFLSSGTNPILSSSIYAGSINAYNSTNGSTTGQVILIASGTITTTGAITTSAGTISAQGFTSNVVSGNGASVNPNYTSFTTSINSSTTINVSVTGISGLFSNYNPQGYSSMSGGSTQLTIDGGGNSSLLAPLLCLGDVSIVSINSNGGTQADGVALAAFGNITLSGTVGVNTVGTTSGGNANLLAVAGQISVVGIETESSGAGAAGNVSMATNGAITVGGTINAYNGGTGLGGTVTLISNSSSVTTGKIDTSVQNGLSSAVAGNVSITALGDINTSGNLIVASNSGTGAGGTVTLASSNSSVTTGEIDTNVQNVLSSAAAGNVIITALGAITAGGTINASNSGAGTGGIVTLTSSNSSVTTGEIDTYFASGSLAAGYVTISAYGAITAGGAINASNAGTGAGSVITLLSSASITTGEIDTNVSVGSTLPGNVNLYAYGAVNTSAGKIEATNGGTVTLASSTSSVTTGEIDTYASGGSTAAGAVAISAYGAITAVGTINASNSGTGAGGTVTLTSSTVSVTTGEIDTYVASGSGAAGNVIISANGAINTNNNAIAAYNGGTGAGGTVFLISSNGSVTTGGIDTDVSGGSAVSGTVTIQANGSITVGGAINASNAGTGAGGTVTLTASNGSVSIGGIQSDVSGGSAAAGNVIVLASGAITVTGAIATDNTGAGAGGSVALISGSTIGLSTITTSGTPSGSVFLSSGYAGTGAIVTGAITLEGGALLATAATSGSITVQSFTNSNTLSVDAGHIYATGTYTNAVDILPLAFTNSATATITPAIIPGGGFASFSNSGTVTLANDAGTSGNVIAFSDLVPVLVQGTVSSLGTINDSTGLSNFFLIAQAVSVSSATAYTSKTGSITIDANQMSLGAINTNGANLNLTALQAITTGTINTINSGGTVAGNATLLSLTSSVTTDAIDTYISSGSAPVGNVAISGYESITTGDINASNSGTGAGGTVNLTTSGNGSVETGQILTSINNTSSNAAAGNVTILAASAISTNQKAINASNAGTGAGGTVTLTANSFDITTGEIDTYVKSGSAPAGNVAISAYKYITTGNIEAYQNAAGAGGNVTLLRAVTMNTGDVDTSSAGSIGGAIVAASSADNGSYSIEMGNLNTSGSAAGGSVLLVSDDFGAALTSVGTITTQASGESGVGGSVGIASLGTLKVKNIDTTNTSASANSGAQSGSVFLSSGKNVANSINADSINAYNNNGSATGQVILISAGTITTSGAITTSAPSIPAGTFTSTVVSGNEASVNPNYTGGPMSISSSTTINVSVTGISESSSNYNPQGYGAITGSSTVLTIDSGGNSSLIAPLFVTAFLPITIGSIKSFSGTKADGVALVVFSNLTLTENVGVDTHGSISGGNVNLVSEDGPISIQRVETYSSGAEAAGNVNISFFGAITAGGTINASNSGTGAGGTVTLISSNSSIATGEIDTYVSGGSAAAGNVTISDYGAITLGGNINAYNSGTGAGGIVTLTSSNSSVTTSEIDTYNNSGSAAAGNVTISAYGAITLGGNINAYNTGGGPGGTVTLSAQGNIGATSSTFAVESPSITLITTNGNIESTSSTTPLLIQSGSGEGTLTLVAQAGGTALLSDTLSGDTVQFNTGTVSSAATLFSLTTLGNITSSSAAVAIESPAITLITTNGNIAGNSGATTALQVQSGATSGILSLIAQASGSALLSDTLAGDAVTVNTSSAGATFGLATAGPMTIAHNVTVSGINSRIDLQSSDTITVDASATIQATSFAASGGLIQFSSLSGAGPVDVVNNGTITATNSNNSSIIGFNSGSREITLSGGGSLSASQVNFGNLNSSTLEINSPFYTVNPFTGSFALGEIFITQNSITGLMQVNYPFPPSPPTPTVVGEEPEISLAGLLALQQGTNAGFGTIIPTDVVQNSIRYVSYTPSIHLTPVEKNTANEGGAVLSDQVKFTPDVIAYLTANGIKLGPGTHNNFLQLQKGNVVLTPRDAVTVQTQECNIYISPGAAVYVMETGHDVAIYDLNDARGGDVQVVVGRKIVTLSPGKQLVLTRKENPKFDQVNPGTSIAYRNESVSSEIDGVTVYKADFSISSALSQVSPLKQMLHSNVLAERKMAQRIMKTAAISYLVSQNKNAYHTGTGSNSN